MAKIFFRKNLYDIVFDLIRQFIMWQIMYMVVEWQRVAVSLMVVGCISSLYPLSPFALHTVTLQLDIQRSV